MDRSKAFASAVVVVICRGSPFTLQMHVSATGSSFASETVAVAVRVSAVNGAAASSDTVAVGAVFRSPWTS